MSQVDVWRLDNATLTARVIELEGKMLSLQRRIEGLEGRSKGRCRRRLKELERRLTELESLIKPQGHRVNSTVAPSSRDGTAKGKEAPVEEGERGDG